MAGVSLVSLKNSMLFFLGLSSVGTCQSSNPNSNVVEIPQANPMMSIILNAK